MKQTRMRSLLAASVLMTVASAWAQAPAPTPPIPAKSACGDCGVVRSVKTITKEVHSPSTDAKPSGLVATVPLGKTDEKPRIGSSSKMGKDAVTKTETWEVTIRLDDGRFKVMMLGEDPNLREGERVRIDANGKIQPRDD